MKKQGFTLIELMVVIVIMGILAAVAVPKLFGMIAKSKASEVGPAAGTYVKLQQAYVSESNALGGWVLIGYSGTGVSDAANSSHTTNFQYYGSIDATSTATSASTDWTAKSSAPLNECPQNNLWTLTANPGTGGTVTFTASNGNNNCVALTPSYCKIATSGSCGS
jgi:prepilin-type N-terminal cleavage/methylation domain-containing protein